MVVCVRVVMVMEGPIEKRAAGFVVKSGGGKNRKNKRNPYVGRDGTVNHVVFGSPIKRSGSVVQISGKIIGKKICMDAGVGDANGGWVGVGGSRPMVP